MEYITERRKSDKSMRDLIVNASLFTLYITLLTILIVIAII